MAQLKNTVVSGSIRATDTLYGTTGQFTTLNIPTTSNGQNYGPGTSGQVLKTNGTSVYWSDADSSISDSSTSTNTPTSAAVANFVQGKGYTLNSEIASQQSNVTTSKAYAIGDLFIYDNKLYKTTAAIAQGGVITPNTNCIETTIDENLIRDIQINSSSILNNKIANIPYASGSDYGVISTSNLLGTAVSNVGKLYIFKSDSNDIKTGTMQYRPIVPYNQHESVFYGLAKAAGDTTQSQSSNTIGTYTTDAKTAILNMLGISNINTISQPTLINNNYIVNSYITEQAYTNGYVSYMCNPFLTIAYINITTSAGLPANSNVFFGKVGRYPKNKIITNVIGVNNTVAQIIIDTDRKIYLYNASGTNSADTFSTIINIITTSNEVSSEQDTINGFPLLLDNAAYNNNVDTILGGTIENNNYAIIGPFDTGSSSSKALTFKTVPAGSNFNNTFIRYYSDLSAISNVNYGITKPENTRTITASYRYFTATVLKSEIDNFFVHDDTNNVYICKGANVQ